MFEPERVFKNYTDSYRQYGEKILIKINHSLRVRDLCAQIAGDMPLSDNQIELASACGLFHDIGRFEQWRQYQTFNDSRSVDHGDLGAEILKNASLLRDFPDADRDTIIKATKYHNKYKVPNTLNAENTQYSKITRDADKIDILFSLSTGELTKDTNDSAMSDTVYQTLLNRQGIQSQNIRTKADRIAVYLAFPFNLNYKKSFEIVKNCRYIDRIIDIQTKEAGNADLKNQLETLRKNLNDYLREQV